MIEGKKVKVRFKKLFSEQRMWVFIGKVIKFSENWVMLDGRGILITKGQVNPVDMDKESRVILVPNSSIAHIRVLPDSFDVANIQLETRGIRIFAKVEGSAPTSITET